MKKILYLFIPVFFFVSCSIRGLAYKNNKKTKAEYLKFYKVGQNLSENLGIKFKGTYVGYAGNGPELLYRIIKFNKDGTLQESLPLNKRPTNSTLPYVLPSSVTEYFTIKDKQVITESLLIGEVMGAPYDFKNVYETAIIKNDSIIFISNGRRNQIFVYDSTLTFNHTSLYNPYTDKDNK